MMRTAWSLLGYVYPPAALTEDNRRTVEVAIQLLHRILVSFDGTVEHERVYAEDIPAFFILTHESFFSTREDVEKLGGAMGAQREVCEIAINSGYDIIVRATGDVLYIPRVDRLASRPPVTCLTDLVAG